MGKNNDIKTMTNTFRLSGQNGGMFSQLLRAAFLTMTAIGGLFLLFFSAAFVLFLIAGIAVIGLFVAAVLWVRAKILGKPFGPKAQLGKMRRDMEQGMSNPPNTARSAQSAAHASDANGPVIDAHETPEGWSVDN